MKKFTKFMKYFLHYLMKLQTRFLIKMNSKILWWTIISRKTPFSSSCFWKKATNAFKMKKVKESNFLKIWSNISKNHLLLKLSIFYFLTLLMLKNSLSFNRSFLTGSLKQSFNSNFRVTPLNTLLSINREVLN